MKHSLALAALSIALLLAPPVHAADTSVPPAMKDYATARDVIVRHLDGLVPVLTAGARPQETLQGEVTAVDERHDRITLHLKSDGTVDLKVQDGLIFNSVRDGEDVEVTVENIDGAKTIVGPSKINNIDWQAFAEPFITTAHAQDIDWPKVDQVLGRKPAVAGDVRRYGFPRTDLTVTLDGVTIKPALALGGWVAFKPAHGGAMIMSDLVLLESEINPVMLKLIASGLEITAVHNHLLRASPATFYMHVGGHGDPIKIAAALRDALAESKTPLTVPAATTPPPAVDLDTAQLDQIMGAKGQANGGVYQFGVPRRDPVTEADMQLSPAGPLGVATGINFQPTGGGKAAITGDFVLIGDEVNPVIMALRANGIEVTAVHSHMLDEQPRLFFLHFWANDDALKLAKGLRAALDKTASTGG
jgi:hypothetical protein